MEESEGSPDEMQEMMFVFLNMETHNCCGPWTSDPILDVEGEEESLGVDCTEVSTLLWKAGWLTVVAFLRR